MSKRIFLILFLSLFLFSVAADFALARELEITYPAIGNVPGPSSTRTLLPDYVKYIFNFAVAISGLVVFGVMIYAGFRYATSAGDPTTMSDAKDRIYSAIIGAIIILASYLLLTTINPQLVVINPILGNNEGVIIYDTLTNCDLGKSNPESQESLKPDKNYIRFGVSSASLEGLNGNIGAIWLYRPTADLIVYLYPDESWGGTKREVTGTAGSCVSSPLLTAKSIELDWQNPGVYLCRDSAGKDCSVYSSSQPKLADGFNDKVVLIKFKNTADVQYGAVLHEGGNYEQTCREFFRYNAIGDPSPDTDNIFPGNGVSSITVFLQLKDGEAPEGAGVTLFEHKDYNQGATGTFVGPYTSNQSALEVFGFHDMASSIKIDGDYMALLFRNERFEGVCEVFGDNDPNLDAGNHIGNDKADSIKVIPARK